MTLPDVRAFYAALGIELPGWPRLEAPVRCFSQPDAHNHSDRSPSCSVNLASGAWNCHGCGARGGAFDAALVKGHTPRSAMGLLIAHGLSEPRLQQVWRSRPGPPVTAKKALATKANRPPAAVDDARVRMWAEALDADSRLVRRLMLKRAWAPRVMRELEIGFDGARITIPIRGPGRHLRGILLYDAFGRRDPKMRAAVGTRLGLMPHPSAEASSHIILVEGPPDMISARSAGLPAIAVPGTNAWHPAWAELLARKRVTIVMDCDSPGRRAADDIAACLDESAEAVEVVDLWPHRNDGYDLTDRILERRLARPHGIAPRTLASLLLPNPSRHSCAPRQNRARSTSGASR